MINLQFDFLVEDKNIGFMLRQRRKKLYFCENNKTWSSYKQ